MCGLNAGDILSGYSATRIRDDLSYYDGEPHVIVEDRYCVEPQQEDIFWQAPPRSDACYDCTSPPEFSCPPPSACYECNYPPSDISDKAYHSAALQVHGVGRY